MLIKPCLPCVLRSLVFSKSTREFQKKKTRMGYFLKHEYIRSVVRCVTSQGLVTSIVIWREEGRLGILDSASAGKRLLWMDGLSVFGGRSQIWGRVFHFEFTGLNQSWIGILWSTEVNSSMKYAFLVIWEPGIYIYLFFIVWSLFVKEMFVFGNILK